MDRWRIIHAYRRIMQAQDQEPWTCPMDYNPMVSQLGKDDEPVLWCYKCDTRVVPGLNMYERMEATIKEFDAKA